MSSEQNPKDKEEARLLKSIDEAEEDQLRQLLKMFSLSSRYGSGPEEFLRKSEAIRKSNTIAATYLKEKDRG